ncbi:MAG: hypothetical protein AB7S26_01515 [Sandaracinaceae bacterium]
MQRRAREERWLAGLITSVVVVGAWGCGSSSTDEDAGGAPHDAGSMATSDAGSTNDASSPNDAGSLADAGSIDGAASPDAGAAPVDAGSIGVDPHFEVDMTFATANIGRSYANRAEMVAALDRVADAIDARAGPRLIGWQEIGEGDPCGTCEIEELEARFTSPWVTQHPRGTRPGGSELVKVPVSARGVGDPAVVRAVFASPGWAGVSPTRFVTVARYADRNLSFVNTHFIASAWSCGSNVAQRRDYWRQAWSTLKDEVAREHDRGLNVIVTGDLNRPRASNDCNPAWDPETLHPDARVIGGAGIDYVFAVPAAGWSFAYTRDGGGAIERGDVGLGIDGHRAHWVGGHFTAP